MIEVASLFVHPVKGLAAVECDRFALDRHGPRYDREWMLVDPDGTFVSQREEARLALIAPEVDETASVLRLRVGAGPPLEVPLSPGDGTPRVSRPVRVWRDTQPALDEGDAAAAWLEDRLGRPLRLVRVAPDHARAVPAAFSESAATTRFTDAFPLLVIGEASLGALNERLEEPVGMRRFRPNIVIRGADAHAEDRWHRIRIGGRDGPVLAFAKCCARCQVTTIDPESAVIAPRGEPLRTLATYRTFELDQADGRTERGVFFGANYVHETLGTIERGAAVAPLD